MDDEQLAREHAQACWNDPINFGERGPRTVAYAKAALLELEKVQAASQGMVQALLEGGNQIARQLNADAFQGFREIVQNADDLGAIHVRVGVRARPGGRELLIVHDGEPVELMHVLPMIYPSISTKRREARAKGRFGVGLKTLSRLGSGLSVHSAPYHFTTKDNFAVRTTAVDAVGDFYHRETDTLITLNLDEDVEPDFLQQAFGLWSSAELLFLDSVRDVTVVDLDAGNVLLRYQLESLSEAPAFTVPSFGADALVHEQRFRLSGRDWVRFAVDVAVPEGRQRAHKATGPTTRVALALPQDGQSKGRIHIALPTRIATGAAFSLDAQFNPATSREELSNDAWNKWLIAAATEFTGSLAIHLARRGSPLAWFVVPVGATTNSTSDWLNERFEAGWSKALAAFASEPALISPAPERPLAEVSYAEPAVDDLLDADDHAAVGGAPMLAPGLRDPHGRWRVVVDALGVSRKITLGAVVRACAQRFTTKPVDWFMGVAQRCLGSGQAELLYEAPWVPLAAGGRAQPRRRADARELLVLQRPAQALADRHELCRLAHPVLLEETSSAVRGWLEAEANLVDQASARDILGAFAARYAAQPLEIAREELVELRDLFADVPERGIDALGAAVGHSLLLEAFRFERDDHGRARPRPQRAKPAELYLSRTIEDEADGWSRAAATTPGLTWAAASYADVFKVPARRTSGALAMRRFRAAKRFLVLLGARTAPRLSRVDTPVDSSLLPLQRRARQVIGRVDGQIRDDYISVDLDRVLADLITGRATVKGRKRRRGSDGEGDRCVALFRCIAANWPDFESRTTAPVYRASGYGGALTWVPTTWIARLTELRWFASEGGELSRPSDLMIGTRITRAIEGDPARFAAGLDARDALQPLARLLRLKIDPRASELVSALEARRQHPDANDGAGLLRIYRALSAYCPQGSSTVSPDTPVGDLTVSSLRAKFGIHRARPGLISGRLTNRGDDSWCAPTAVHAGKDVFHGREPFVLAERDLAPLWTALNIRPPAVEDCVRQLEDIARAPPETAEEALLIDIYRHLDKLLSERPTAVERRRLEATPLRVGDGWLTTRPIYLSDYHRVEVTGVAIWSPPCAPNSMAAFVEAAGVETLRVEDAPRSQVFGESAELQARLEAAVRILRSDLARDDEASYRALEPWDRLATLALNLHGVDSLVVQACPRNAAPFPMVVRAHSDVEGRALHAESTDVLARAEYGGAAIARFAGPARRREIALAWASAWAASADEPVAAVIALAGDEARSDGDALTVEFERQSRMPRRRVVQTRKGPQQAPTPPPRIEVRKLKPLPTSVEFSVLLRDGAADAKTGMQTKRTTPLRSGPRSGSSKHAPQGDRAPVTAHRQYDSKQLQAQGWAYVQAAIEEGEIILSDLQNEHGVGADGTIDWKRYFEMKSYGREPPAALSLTIAEFQRARLAKGEFFLVVVSGLEEGFDVELRIYADPLNSLPWTVQGGVTISGLGSGRAVELRASMEPDVTGVD